MRKNVNRGFTLIELLVVVAIIALLISILLPALNEAREQAKRLVCGTNLKGVATAFHTYATEDPKELIVPIHRMHVNNNQGFWDGTEWCVRTMQPTAWGGMTAIRPFPTGASSAPHATLETGNSAVWAARTRPLNKYLYGSLGTKDAKDLKFFKCPSDIGYPRDSRIRDVPLAATNIPLWELTGNSYRIGQSGIFWTTGGSSYLGAFSVAPFGHKLSSLKNLQGQLMAAEALIYEMTPLDPTESVVSKKYVGWHRRVSQDNAMFADGSVRNITVTNLIRFGATELEAMNVGQPNSGNESFLRRGEQHRIDCWPTPGALVRIFSGGTTPTPVGTGGGGLDFSKWPFPGYEDNMKP